MDSTRLYRQFASRKLLQNWNLQFAKEFCHARSMEVNDRVLRRRCGCRRYFYECISTFPVWCPHMLVMCLHVFSWCVKRSARFTTATLLLLKQEERSLFAVLHGLPWCRGPTGFPTVNKGSLIAKQWCSLFWRKRQFHPCSFEVWICLILKHQMQTLASNVLKSWDC